MAFSLGWVRFSQLSVDSARESLVRLFVRESGQTVSEERIKAGIELYLRRVVSYGIWRKRGGAASNELLAGFALGSASFSPWVNYLKPDELVRHRELLDQSYELNLVVVDRAFRKTWVTAALWIWVAWRCSRVPTQKILFGVDTKRVGLVKLYQKITLERFGPIGFTDGREDIYFYVTSPQRMRQVVWRYAAGLAARVVGRSVSVTSHPS